MSELKEFKKIKVGKASKIFQEDEDGVTYLHVKELCKELDIRFKDVNSVEFTEVNGEAIILKFLDKDGNVIDLEPKKKKK